MTDTKVLTTKIQLKRAYDPESNDDGFRIYIDRLWPQGLSHLTFRYDLWDKEVSPSPQLRQWFHADPANRWEEFAEKYKAELLANPAFAKLRDIIARHPVVTLLYSSHDQVHNNAVVLERLLESSK